MTRPIRLFIADDHLVFRQMLEHSLGTTYEIVPGASTLDEVEEAFRRGGFDIAILDLSWRDEGSVGPHLARWYRLQPAVRVIILTAMDEWFLGQAFLDEGARGFLGKRSDFAEVAEAVATVATGGTYLGRDLQPPPRHAAGAPLQGGPSPIGRRILECLALGMRRNEIAKVLHRDVRTVDFHIAKMRRVLGINRWGRPNWKKILPSPSANGEETGS